MNLLEHFKDKKIFQWSHNDLDGVGAIIVGKYFVGPISSKFEQFSADRDDIEACDHTTLSEYDIILFTDITPTKELYNNLIEQGQEVLVFDHHISAYTDLMNTIPEEKYIYAIDRCGTQIFFDSLNEGRRTSKCIYQFVELVNTYDLWQENSALWNEGKALHNILWGSVNWGATDNMTKYNKFIENQLDKFYKGKIFYFTQYEDRLIKSALNKEKENLAFAKKNIEFRTDGEGNNYAYFECTSKLSIIANMILKEYNQLDYVVCHSTFKDRSGVLEPSVSLRSPGTMDVSLIAQIYECGGHKQASGISFKDHEFFLKFRKGEVHLI